MTRRSLLVAGLLMLGFAGCTGRAPPRLAGQWAPVSAELGGKDFPVPNFGGANLQLTDSTYEFANDRGTYSVLSAKSPGTMDIHGEEGPNAGRTIQALYEIGDEQLTIAYQLGAGERPTEFTSPQESRIFIVNYTRVH